MFMIKNEVTGELVGVTTSSEKAFELAEYTDDLLGQAATAVFDGLEKVLCEPKECEYELFKTNPLH